MDHYAGVKEIEDEIWRLLRQSKEALSPREINDRLGALGLKTTLATVVAVLQDMRERKKVEVKVQPLAQGGTKYRMPG